MSKAREKRPEDRTPRPLEAGKQEERKKKLQKAQIEESRQEKEKKHQEEPEVIPVQNPTHTTPHPTETPEEGRAEVQ